MLLGATNKWSFMLKPVLQVQCLKTIFQRILVVSLKLLLWDCSISNACQLLPTVHCMDVPLLLLSVYVMTAANSTQSSYACNLVLKLETYISDCFSLNWIKNTAAAATDHETLELQYQDVKKETTKSNVTQYGQLVRVLPQRKLHWLT